MDNNICNVCGANYIFKNDMWVCPACGNFKPVEVTKEELVLLWNASAQLRRANFQDAEELYTDFIAKYPENCEGYWGRLLARYGIKYEDDIGGKKVPTIYAMSIESVLNDFDYFKAVMSANGAAREYYKREAAKFEQIRTEWQEKASKEAPVDIFISFKDSDTENNIDRTNDSYEAYEIYTHLKEQGYSVFFSRESLRDKLAEKFEPYIFNALNTARVMIIYTSKKEYLESTWVKNEWLRFLKKIKNGEKEKNSLILAYEKMSPKDFPTVFKNLQCMDASKKTFYGDLDKHINKLLHKDDPVAPLAPVAQSKVRAPRSKRVEDPQTKTAFIYLSKGLYDEVKSSFAEALAKNPNNAEALFGDIILRLKTSDDNEPTRVVDGINVYDDINIAAASVDSTKGLLYADNILNSLTCNLASAEDSNFAKSIVLFDRLLQLVDRDECAGYSKNLYGVAKDCQARKMFDKAKSYYDIMISSGENVGEAYWGLLQLNLNAVDDDALIRNSTLITTFPEFNRAMAYAEDDTTVNRYLGVRGKQLELIEAQKDVELARIEREKAEETARIARKKASEEAARISAEEAKQEKIFKFTFDGNANAYIVAGIKDKGLTNLYIPTQYNGLPVVAIGDSALSWCQELASIRIPNSVTSICDYAFWGCQELASISIPNSVTSIGDNAFDGCSGLAIINVDSDNSRYRSERNCIIEKSTNTLIAGCKNSVIPTSVTNIGWAAFCRCHGLTSITIPGNVRSIDCYAFAYCSGLTSITIPSSVTSIGWNAFDGFGRGQTIIVKGGNVPVRNWDKKWDKGCKAKIVYEK